MERKFVLQDKSNKRYIAKVMPKKQAIELTGVVREAKQFSYVEANGLLEKMKDKFYMLDINDIAFV